MMQVGDFLVKAEDQLKLDVIVKIEAGQMDRVQGQALLQVSESTLKRYIKSYREKGIGFLRHGNASRKPVNKICDQLKSRVQTLIQEKYYDFNMLHANEKIYEEIGKKIQRETLRKWCHEIGMVKRAKRRRSRPRFKRPRMPQPGLLLQMDGSPHRWFGDRETCLIAVIDDATSEVVHAAFSESETTLACLEVLKEVIRKKEVFQVLYVDRAGVFGGIKRNHFSQVERALAELGTHVIYANSPEAKGRIERLFNTLQDRLIPEMRINKIRTQEQANEYLKEVYLPHRHNARFAVQAHNPISAYRAVPEQVNLTGVFCFKETRIIGRDHTISVGGEKYMIAENLKFSIYKQKIELRFDKNGRWRAYFAGKEMRVAKVQKQRAGGAAA